jgi:5-methylcytosine-specific restriction endonuclease McrA
MATKGIQPKNLAYLHSLPRTKEWKEKMSLAHRGKPCPEHIKKQLRENRKGDKGSNWKGGVTTEQKLGRISSEWRLWRIAIFTRDDFKCKRCVNGGYLHPHHIQNYSEFKELRYAIDNGITLCEKCHRLFHKLYGMKGNNKGQLKEFIDQI